jgi:GT2 family glycosyltransferase
MDVSIIIPSFNTKHLTGRCLRSIIETLKRATFTYEIIVVDNASADGTVELLNTKFPQVIKILNKENLGYSTANNMGLHIAKGTYVLMLNSDIEVLNGSLAHLYEFARLHPKSFVGGKLYNEDGSLQPSCGPMFTLWYVFLMLFCQADMLSVTRYSPDHPRRVDWVSGACLMGARASFYDVGLFDQEIFMYMDEVEFLYRAGRKGYKVFFTPHARFIHTGAASSGNKREPVKNIFRGLMYFYRKHRTPAEVSVLKFMVRAKAAISITIGKIFGKQDLVHIYEEGLALVNQ